MAATLASLRPKWLWTKKLTVSGLALLIGTILVSTYIATDIDPLRLWEKRQNAYEYLFGQEVSEEDKLEARRQAERLPEMLTKEQARSEINQKYAKRDDKPPYDVREKLISSRAAEIAAAHSQAYWDQLVEEEYESLLEDRRGGYFPPETNLSKIKSYTDALLETVAIAIWGSLLAFLTAIPVAFFAAENTMRIIAPGDGWLHRSIRWFSCVVVRRFLDACRGFNEFVMALIFVAVIGLGPFAGVLALWIHTFGILGKVVSEAFEACEQGQVEGVLATGASPSQVLSFSVLPQAMPAIVSYSLLRFEANVRSATILGFCGAGGIGFLMFDKLNGYLFQEVATMMILVILTVAAIDFVTGKLRKMVI
jgi:phosphonate transport system permease protein